MLDLITFHSFYFILVFITVELTHLCLFLNHQHYYNCSYVDDVLLIGNNHPFIADLLMQLSYEFAIKDLNLLHYFLVSCFNKGIFLTQQKYMYDLLAKAEMLESNDIATPLVLQ